MSKPEQVLIIEPQNELKFKGPFNVPVTSYMKLTNPSETTVFFKIKTTAPKKYCVRPNSGKLLPKEVAEIAITLQPLESGVDKNKHKFMVQSVFVPEVLPEEQSSFNVDRIWKLLSPEEFMDSKLKCVFELPPEEINKERKQDEPVEASPNTTPPAVPNDQTNVVTELKELRESEHSLRQENNRLKEEVLRLKMNTRGNLKTETVNKYQPPASQENMAVLIIVAVVLGILGMILGKFML
ncbi:vesicle-associated membrane protein-associated protein B/C-like isoform X2 [Harmonia axyridis]|uniref:vesicle-associated membrane protein-associated protein B/C-like isoform X2 n=1 Tax=Harmonia axyridis TaxID=115357 RepID=UPI001E27944E|nr:vesicle-associated membrane protein-associated protein B/C-like isoform X2 [Harmonia axyridis]